MRLMSNPAGLPTECAAQDRLRERRPYSPIMPAFSGRPQRGKAKSSSSVRGSAAPGRGNKLGVVLPVPFRTEKIIITAAPAGTSAAGRRPCGVNRATAFFRVEEAAHHAENLVLLAAHGVFLVFARHGEFPLRFAEANTEMVSQPFDVAFGKGNEVVGAAVTRALRAIVHGHSAGHFFHLSQCTALQHGKAKLRTNSAPSLSSALAREPESP